MIWQACSGADHIGALAGTAYRLVESQEQIATTGFVDTLEEQAVIEELLEGSKPPNAEATAHLHYLLKTPFRYPPLPWGSRFGTQAEPSLFYGGNSIRVALAESAYYRLVFLFSIAGQPPKPLTSEHSLFSVGYATALGVRLQQPPFSNYAHELTDPRDYRACQQLGRDMRRAGVRAFEYTSARDREEGTCIALFTPDAFTQDSPESLTPWLCQASQEGVRFMPMGSREVCYFPIGDFRVEGELPLPA
ncbi:RES family NAD+ phosphorylase [Motiliproteus sp. SC1-56]|uniref:RES family NAD+ phosphorylase n=1 Tax=Motiliproteus sp. SC1-56 TaxID=2799565 RepID=UPI001A8F6D52|nr:RES family NAD+ phosphorylase [Motiliproteus sp. SC1-56]